MTQSQFKRTYKKRTQTIDFIQDLIWEIKYLNDVLSNGYYKNQIDKINKSSELESLKKMLFDIKQEFNKY